MTSRAQGRDWSAYQGQIPAAAMAGLSFGYARATSWSGPVLGADPDFAGNWAAMKQAGLHRGAYHYLKTSVSVASQASYFTRLVGEHGLEPGDMLVCDSELAVAGAGAATAEFCDRVTAEAGPCCPVLVYTNHDTGQLLTGCTRYPLWIAWPSTAPDPDPSIVAPWPSWRFWQRGEIGGTDADVYNGTDADLQAWLDTFRPPARVEHWRTLGIWSLEHEAADHGTTPQEMIELAAAAGHVYGPAMKRYVAAADWNARLPAGTILYAPERQTGRTR